jgi:hypothetical protein
MKPRNLLFAAVLIAAAGSGFAATAQAGYSYYSRWSYYPTYGYYYSYYYYKPYDAYAGYKYHYTIYYPKTSYVYYYNPYRKVYWGRYDLEAKGYSHLPEEAQKGSLKEIPESAFPKPGAMPAVPESNDGTTVPPPPTPPADAPRDAAPPPQQ